MTWSKTGPDGFVLMDLRPRAPPRPENTFLFLESYRSVSDSDFHIDQMSIEGLLREPISKSMKTAWRYCGYFW